MCHVSARRRSESAHQGRQRQEASASGQVQGEFGHDCVLGGRAVPAGGPRGRHRELNDIYFYRRPSHFCRCY